MYTFQRVLFVYTDTPKVRSIRSIETKRLHPVSYRIIMRVNTSTAFTCMITNFGRILC